MTPLLPAPASVRAAAGSFPLRDGLPLVLTANAVDSDFTAARVLRDALRRVSGLMLPIEGHARTPGLGPRIELRREGDDGESYRIRVTPKYVEAVGAGPAGLRYAVETLAQLVSPSGRIPACEIEDAPDFQLRGLMLDVSRGKVPTQESLEQLIDLCVRLKLNALMLYTEHTFRFRRHPMIGADASPLDAETMRALDAYAAKRHVDLIPTLQSLGHMGHVLKHAAYAELDESDQGWTLSPAEPGTYELLRDLYDEYLPNFRSPFFNANCDEPWDLCTGKSKQRGQELGRGGVFLDHVRRARDLAAEHGKRTMIWGDMVHRHPELLPEIDRDLVLLDWWYEAELDFDRVEAFRRSGIDFLVCPGTSSWNCLFPRIENSTRNITRWVDAGRRHGAMGVICTDWGDFGHYNLLGNSWLAFAWTAQQAWSGEIDQKSFDRAFGRLLFGETRGAVASCYRALGAVHDAGFPVANGSSLQFLFFDDLDRAFFLQQAKPAALRRSLRRLERCELRLREAGDAFARDPLTRGELTYATEASLFAVRKALVAGEWLAWRKRPGRLDAGGRRRLARSLERLAGEQTELGKKLARLWKARSRPSNFEITRRRISGSRQSLRRAARALRRNAAPPPAPDHAEIGLRSIYLELRQLTEGSG
jgi:hexosaminidase